ncbi:hypothetical protein LEP1GSC050_2820 [Leptospira broomii serovar Hurstbridge str. 5399]|uniref:Uncharacterized protein n=1 Tax=Leptospira broomii serovar Hurstbridge str. 5399 TaxID=1049789 RepID=T0F9P6_9LEPT|nr:hypothetical protein LEP1GSC050_2820 [Leptospira broomii serovar Hurstbridge str. 5399]
MAIQGGKEGPEGLLLPLKSFQQEFCFDRIRDTIGNNIHSKETERYSYSLYKIILKLDSLLIHLSENKELNK